MHSAGQQPARQRLRLSARRCDLHEQVGRPSSIGHIPVRRKHFASSHLGYLFLLAITLYNTSSTLVQLQLQLYHLVTFLDRLLYNPPSEVEEIIQLRHLIQIILVLEI